MSGKFEKKKARKGRGMIWIICVLAALLVAAMMFFSGKEPVDPDFHPPADPDQTTEGAAGESTATQPSGPTEALQGMDLGSGVVITELLSYTGAFMEDRTDEVVTDVLAIRVTNTGEKYIQTMDITLTAGDVQAQFSLSTLFPGQTVIVLEKNRMAYSTAPEFEDARAGAVAFFESHPGMCEDKLEIQCLDGVLNITNISGEDITGDILVYYKNYMSGIYYGGITYRIRIQGGLKAGEIRQGSAAHFNTDNSTVVFVTCG